MIHLHYHASNDNKLLHNSPGRICTIFSFHTHNVYTLVLQSHFIMFNIQPETEIMKRISPKYNHERKEQC
jgi:hypothetical protein